MATDRVRPIYALASYRAAHDVFQRTIHNPEISRKDILGLLREYEDWNTASVVTFRSIPHVRVSKRFRMTGDVVNGGLLLAGRLDTAGISDWLHDATVDAREKESFLRIRDGLNERLAALATIAREAFVGANFDLPVRRRTLTVKLAQLLGGRRILGIETGALGAIVGSLRVYRDTPMLRKIVAEARSTRGERFSREARALVDRFGEALGDSSIDESKVRHLLRANEVLAEAGVGPDETDALMETALGLGEQVSSQPWKGLVRIFELVKNAKLDPTSPEFARRLESATTDGIYCAHRRGAEYVVNDWQVARAVLDLDSRYVDTEGDKQSGRGERPEDAVIRVSQAAGSVLPGIVAANEDLAALGAEYHPALRIHLTAMVTKDGEEHRAHKRTFDPYFSTSAISNLSAFIGATMDQVLDEVAADAGANDGAFDFRQDFAFNFPIRVTCEILGLPPQDAEMVRDLTQSAMRSLDIGGGMSQETLVEGGRATRDFEAYLERRLSSARKDSASSDHEIKGVLGDLGDKLRRLEEGSLLADAKEIRGTLLEYVANAGTEEESRAAFDAIIANLGVLVFAGFETTMSSVSMGIYELLKRDGQWEYLRDNLIQDPEIAVDGRRVPDTDLRWYEALPKRDVDGAMEVVEARLSTSEKARSQALTDSLHRSERLRDRLGRVGAQEQLLKNAVEEMMRWTAPGSVIPLTTQHDLAFPAPCDTTMEGRLVKQGEMIRFPKGSGVTVDVRAANRSRESGRTVGAGGCPFASGVLAPKSGDFDVSREAQIPAKGHLSFGSGAHVCLGANLAVENSKRMLEAVLRRCPDLQINGIPEETDTTLFMGFNSFPVRSRALAQA